MWTDGRHQSKRVHVWRLRSSCKVADIFSLFFINIFSQESPTSDFRNIHPLGAEMIHSDGRTSRRSDMMKVTGAFCDYANAPTETKHWFNLLTPNVNYS